MTSSDQRKPGEKSGKRKQKKAKKAEQRRAPAQAASEPIEAAVAPEEAVETVAVIEAAAASEPIETAIAPEEAVASVAAVEAAPAEPVERVASFRERLATVMPPADTAPDKPAAPADIAQPVPSPAAAPATGVQAIANAYRDYTKKSLEDAQSFAEKLTAARSFDKAVEAQTEFARQACENFADNSRKIRELHRELFWQAFRLPGWPPGRTPR